MAKRDLFVFDPYSAFPISLVYDKRQQVALLRSELKNHGAKTHDVLDRIRQEYDRRRTTFEREVADYNRRGEQFKKQSQAFLSEAQSWNRNPGTDSRRERLLWERSRLEALEAALDATQRSLIEQLDWLKTAERSMQSIAQKHNQRIPETRQLLNSALEEYRKVGVTQINGPPASIAICRFDNRKDLRSILIHELGHALGVLHSRNPVSVM